MQKIVIYGIGDFAKTVSYYLEDLYNISAYCVDSEYKISDSFLQKPIITYDDLLIDYSPDDYKIFVAIGYQNININREKIFLRLKNKGYKFISYVHPTAVYPKNFDLKNNIFIMENVVIQPYTEIGDNTIILSNTVVCHDSIVEDNCYISAGSCINGFAKIGKNVFIGSNATIRDKIKIGAYSLIGAGCTILDNTKDYSVYKSNLSSIINKKSNIINI